MQGFVANTDLDWFESITAADPPEGEVNFWRAGTEGFRALRPGEPFFLKLRVPENAIAGVGFFTHFSVLPASLAWEIYGPANGAASAMELRRKILQVRARLEMPVEPREDSLLGCILLNRVMRFAEDDRVRIPEDFGPRVGQGKVYDLDDGEGRRIWSECLARMRREDRSLRIADGSGGDLRYGPNSFRVAVLDAWGRRCAISGEATLPVLEAAQIRQFPDGRDYSISNGILLRADLKRLFESGYITVTPDYRCLVSEALLGTEIGRGWKKFHRRKLVLPENPMHHPAVESLWWHNEQRFLG